MADDDRPAAVIEPVTPGPAVPGPDAASPEAPFDEDHGIAATAREIRWALLSVAVVVFVLGLIVEFLLPQNVGF